MRFIELVQVPNQAVSVTLGGSRWDVRIRVATTIMVVDISRDGAPIVQGQRAVPGEFLIPYAYLLADGPKVNFGIATDDNDYPWWEQFGTSQRLIVVGDDL